MNQGLAVIVAFVILIVLGNVTNAYNSKSFINPATSFSRKEYVMLTATTLTFSKIILPRIKLKYYITNNSNINIKQPINWQYVIL